VRHHLTHPHFNQLQHRNSIQQRLLSVDGRSSSSSSSSVFSSHSSCSTTTTSPKPTTTAKSRLVSPQVLDVSAHRQSHHHHHHHVINVQRRSMMSIFPVDSLPSNHIKHFNTNNHTASQILQEKMRLMVANNNDNDDDGFCNIPPHIADKVGRNLHLQRHHPLGILCQIIVQYFQSQENSGRLLHSLTHISNLSPLVSTRENFDSLLIPSDHVSRSRSDTYYLNPETVLRTHTSAHQEGLLRQGHDAFLVSGDVYRRDDIDASHYPVFHQMEGVQLFQFARTTKTIDNDSNDDENDPDQVSMVLDDLKVQLEGLARHLFGSKVPMRWVEAYFPFTDPSLELEIWLPDHKQDDGWLEVLGCGVMQPQILQRAGIDIATETTSTKAWAFGLGLERLAMVLFDIPDIRLFWSTDERFLQQFASVQVGMAAQENRMDYDMEKEDENNDDTVVRVVEARSGGWKSRLPKFQPYSKYPPVYKDIAFWLVPDDELLLLGTNKPFHVQDLNELVRQVAGDLVEQVELVDDFSHPTTGKRSHCYRITYRSMDRSLTNEEIDALQQQVRTLLPSLVPGVVLR
jgi:phenylalanyl-tRNA synthetase alpha chain